MEQTCAGEDRPVTTEDDGEVRVLAHRDRLIGISGENGIAGDRLAFQITLDVMREGFGLRLVLVGKYDDASDRPRLIVHHVLLLRQMGDDLLYLNDMLLAEKGIEWKTDSPEHAGDCVRKEIESFKHL